MEVFERGFRALQERNFPEATRLFSSIFDAYPDEKELHERGRVYLAICERRTASKDEQKPRTFEERLNSATVAINRGAFDEALKLLRTLERENGGNDLVHYMLAVTHAALGDAGEAIPHLRQAVELNGENRYLALQDADLEPLRAHQDFVKLLEPPPPSARRGTMRLRPGG